MEQITYQWFSEHKQEVFAGEMPKAYCVVSDKLEVHIGNAEDCDVAYCQEHGIPVYDLGRTGGTIVCCDGTIGVALITDVKQGWRNHQFTDAFKEFLKRKGLEPHVERNDILLDDYKTASSAEWRVGEDLSRIYGVYLLSWDVDIEAILHICKKEMKKTPKGLKDFGLTKEELIKWCEDYFTKIEEEA